jgi:hypothetical protein
VLLSLALQLPFDRTCVLNYSSQPGVTDLSLEVRNVWFCDLLAILQHFPGSTDHYFRYENLSSISFSVSWHSPPAVGVNFRRDIAVVPVGCETAKKASMTHLKYNSHGPPGPGTSITPPTTCVEKAPCLAFMLHSHFQRSRIALNALCRSMASLHKAKSVGKR